MNFERKVIKVSGKEIDTMLLDESAIYFSNQDYKTADAFRVKDSFVLAQTKKIPYDTILSITNEDQTGKISLTYKGTFGIKTTLVFSFFCVEDREFMFSLLEKEQYFKQVIERDTPIKAILPHCSLLIGLILVTIIAHLKALEYSTMTEEEILASGGIEFFNLGVRLLGDLGIWIVSAVIGILTVYLMVQRFINPPYQIRFLPPNS